MYAPLDEILERLIKQIYRLFRKYRSMPLDELNTVGQVNALYKQLEQLNRQAFEQIAEYYYRQEGGMFKQEWQEWLDKILREPSQVMLYSYDKEIVRKRDHLVEALQATTESVTEFDKAMRYWVAMTGWFAVEVADDAMEQAREEQGIDLVMWCSEHDNKVCDKCWKRNGQIYHLATVPPKPHPNCRCWTMPVEEEP